MFMNKFISSDFIVFIENVELIEKVYKKSKLETFPSDQKEDINRINILRSNGLYYFKSYIAQYHLSVLKQDLETKKLEEMLREKTIEFESLFLEVINKLSKYEIVNSNTFKKDELWDDMKKLYEEQNKSESVSGKTDENENKNLELDVASFLEELNKLVNEINSKSKYSIAIKQMINNNEIDIQNIIKKECSFRTIRIYKDKKNQKYKVHEALPLPRDSFMEFPLNLSSENTFDESFVFENSEFYKSLTTQMQYVILYESSNNDKIENIKVVMDILNNKDIKRSAKEFFNQLRNFFENGDSSFEQIESEYFHIRPNARKSRDTFTFTTGEEVVKSTIWVNKNKIEDLINGIIDSENKTSDDRMLKE